MPTQTLMKEPIPHIRRAQAVSWEEKEKAEWAISELVNPQLNGHLISFVLKPYVISLDHFLSFPLLVMDVFQLLGVNTLMYCSPSPKSCAPNAISMLYCMSPTVEVQKTNYRRDGNPNRNIPRNKQKQWSFFRMCHIMIYRIAVCCCWCLIKCLFYTDDDTSVGLFPHLSGDTAHFH